MSDSVRPHRRQPTRLPGPWDSPGKNTGVGCHFLLQCMKVKSESEVAQSDPTLSDPMDCSLPGSSVHGIFQESLFITHSPSLLKLMAIKLVMLPNQLMFCRPLLLLPSVFPNIRAFSNESVPRIRWLKHWSFSFRISPSHEYSGLIFFRIDWLDNNFEVINVLLLKKPEVDSRLLGHRQTISGW